MIYINGYEAREMEGGEKAIQEGKKSSYEVQSNLLYKKKQFSRLKCLRP